MLHCDSRSLCTASSGIKNSRWQRKPRSSTAEMSWLSRVINLITFSVIFYCTKWVVLNAALLLPPGKILILQMLQVTIGLLLFSNLSYFHTADILSKGLPEQRYTRVWVLPQIVLWRKKKKKNWPWVHVPISTSLLLLLIYVIFCSQDVISPV